jgi:peptide/nickel transport system substrate-binding protein
VLLIACGAAATAVPPPTAAPVPTAGFAPAPTVLPTARPTQVVAKRTDITVVINVEPPNPDIFLATTAYPYHIGLNVVPGVALLGPDFVDTPTAGIESFKMETPNRWVFKLTPGVKFHNGEPWDAAAAKFSIDFHGDVKKGSQAFSNVDTSHGEVIDPMTVAWVCDKIACPVLLRYASYHTFQAPAWYQNTPADQRNAEGRIIGWGPYQFKEWKKGESYTIEQFPGYVEPKGRFIAQRGSIKTAKYVWRNEELVRSAMVETGEADLAFNLDGTTFADRINKSANGKTVRANTGETYTLNVDTIWDPFLKDLKVRQALAHAVDCPAMALALFGPLSKCHSGPNGPGVLGINETNTKPIYTYNVAKAKQLLQESGYTATGANVESRHQIHVWNRQGRYPKDVEVGEALAAYWKEAGINVKVNVVDDAIWQTKHLTGPGRILAAGGTIESVATSKPPAPNNASPGMVMFAPGGELFDFGRQLSFYMSCGSNRGKNCDPVRQKQTDAALSAIGAEREKLMTAAYDEFATSLLHLPFMDIVGVWGVNKDLDYIDMPGGRRIQINTAHWLK